MQFPPAVTASGKERLTKMLDVQGTARVKSTFLLYSVAEKCEPSLSRILSLYYVTVSQSLTNVVGRLQ